MKIFLLIYIYFSIGFRSSYSDPSSQYVVLLFTALFFRNDYRRGSETFLVDYFLVSIIFKKTAELLLKVNKNDTHSNFAHF